VHDEYKKRLPSLFSRLALRLVLVIAVQVSTLLLLVLSLPRVTAALGKHLLSSHQSAIEFALQQQALSLALTAPLVAQSASPGTQNVGVCDPTLTIVLEEDSGKVVEPVDISWPQSSMRELAQLLRSKKAQGQPAWAWLYVDDTFYTVGATVLDDTEGRWLILACDSGAMLRQISKRVAGTEEIVLSPEGAPPAYVAPISVRSLLYGPLTLAVPVSDCVGAPNMALLLDVPIFPLSTPLRATALIYGAGLLLAFGGLCLVYLYTYNQVTNLYRPHMIALRDYAATGTWQPPRCRFREDQETAEALTEAIEARQRAETEARRRLTELKAFLDNLPAHAFIKNKHLKIVMANRQMAESLGLTREQLVGLTDFDLYPEELARTYREHDRQVLRQRRTLHFEEELWLDGTKRVYRVTKAPIVNGGGRILGLVGVAIDITDQKELEERLIEAQKMQVVGRLAGGLGHSFNNLLTAIVGFAELALMSVESEHPAHKDLEQILEAAKRGSTFSHQLLVLSRQRLGTMQTLDLNELIQQMMPLIEETAGQDVQVDVKLADDLPKVQGDPTQLHQVLLNLVLNAREAMPEGGQLYIETQLCEAPEEAWAIEPRLKESPVICLEVRDTGMGIPEEARAHVFEPFFSTKNVAAGQGLGLPVAYSIVRQHHGAILFKTEERCGTAFMVFLPTSPPSEAPEADTEEEKLTASRPSGQIDILIVEDEAMVRHVAERILSKRGYSVAAAESGEEALAMIAEKGEPPNLLLTDVVMPGMSGVELASAVHEKYPETKILLMSGYSGEPDQDMMEGFPILWKPFDPETLTQRVKALLDS